jgi:DNA polymerase III subunit epsilon
LVTAQAPEDALISPEQAVARLASDPDYRVLKRLDPASVGGAPLRGGAVWRAAIIDVETTGLDSQTDQVIEIGMVVFEYAAATGQIGPVVGHFSALEDPGRPIPPEVTAIHHITDEMVKDQHFDDAAITKTLAGVSLIIAHNAPFDRPFLEKRYPQFAQYPWGCSLRDIPWRDSGYGSAALEFLAYRMGFFYEGHRAEIDCRALLAILSRPLGDTGRSAFQTLLEHARKPTIRLYALNSPFESKDLLKARGYTWLSKARVWALDQTTADWDAERAWLKQAVYAGTNSKVEIEIETLDAQVRYSEREGHKERVAL